jgi:hypothetical protein
VTNELVAACGRDAILKFGDFAQALEGQLVGHVVSHFVRRRALF